MEQLASRLRQFRFKEKAAAWDGNVTGIRDQILTEVKRQFRWLEESDITFLTQVVGMRVQQGPQGLENDAAAFIQFQVISSYLRRRFGTLTDAGELTRATLQPLRPSLMVNTLRSSHAAITRLLDDIGFEFEEVGWAHDTGLFAYDRQDEKRSADSIKAMLRTAGEGRLYVKEAASMVPPYLFPRPPTGKAMKVLDMCSAPGGKTLRLAGMFGEESEIVANDRGSDRLEQMRRVLKEQGASFVRTTNQDGREFAKTPNEFDYVLCDVPCTGSGNLRKGDSPENIVILKLGPDENSFPKVTEIQRELLLAAIATVKPGGTVVYSTCSNDPREDEEAIHWVLSQSNEVEIVDPRSTPAQSANQKWDLGPAIADANAVQAKLGIPKVPVVRIWPHRYDTSGFFAAVLKKKEK